MTFRKWNPEKIRVPYGQATDAESATTTCSPLCCYMCVLVDCCCDSLFEEVVDQAVDTKMTASEFFDEQDKNIATAAKIIRPSGIFLTILGIFFLFSPIMALLEFIPLVGSLMSFAVAIAAGIFAFIVGLVISCLVIAIAWVFYRPLVGLSLLALAGIGLYLIFIFPDGEAPVTNGSDPTNVATLSNSDVSPSVVTPDAGEQVTVA